MDPNPVQSFINATKPVLNEYSSEASYILLGAGMAWSYVQLRSMYNRRQAKLAISTGQIKGHSAILGETLYVSSGEINPVTKQEFMDQWIRNYGCVDLNEIFHPHIRAKAMEYVISASKCCSSGQPIVFQHLHKVIPHAEYDVTRKMITDSWVNYFSGIATPLPKVFQSSVSGRQVRAEKTILPILVYEPGAVKKQFRILFMHDNQRKLNDFPSIKNLRFPSEGEYVHDLKHPHLDRHTTNTAIARALSYKETRWLSYDCSVGFPTGEMITIPAPSTDEQSLTP